MDLIGLEQRLSLSERAICALGESSVAVVGRTAEKRLSYTLTQQVTPSRLDELVLGFAAVRTTSRSSSRRRRPKSNQVTVVVVVVVSENGEPSWEGGEKRLMSFSRRCPAYLM